MLIKLDLTSIGYPGVVMDLNTIGHSSYHAVADGVLMAIERAQHLIKTGEIVLPVAQERSNGLERNAYKED